MVGVVSSLVGVLCNILSSNADMELNESAGDVNTTNYSFQKNSASVGGAIFIVSIGSTLINSSTFTNNTAVGGAAGYAVNSYIPLFCCCFEMRGAMYLNGMKVIFDKKSVFI